MGEALGRQADVEGHIGRAQPQDCEQGGQRFDRPAGDDADDITGLHPGGLQLAGEAVGDRIEFAVAQAPAAVADSAGVRMLRDRLCEGLLHPRVGAGGVVEDIGGDDGGVLADEGRQCGDEWIGATGDGA